MHTVYGRSVNTATAQPASATACTHSQNVHAHCAKLGTASETVLQAAGAGSARSATFYRQPCEEGHASLAFKLA